MESNCVACGGAGLEPMCIKCGSRKMKSNVMPLHVTDMDAAVMARLRAPFGCEYVVATAPSDRNRGRWRIFDANDDCIATVSGLEEGYARLIVRALNKHFARGDR